MSFTIGWRNDLNWANSYFRIVGKPGHEAVDLAVRLSGKPAGSLYVVPPRAGDEHLPVYVNGEFLYTSIGVYSNKPSTGKSMRGGKWYAYDRVLV